MSRDTLQKLEHMAESLADIRRARKANATISALKAEVERLKEEVERLENEADGEFVRAAISVMKANPGFDYHDYSDGITADDFEQFFTEDMNEAWRCSEKEKARAEAAEAEAARLTAERDAAMERVKVLEEAAKDAHHHLWHLPWSTTKANLMVRLKAALSHKEG